MKQQSFEDTNIEGMWGDSNEWRGHICAGNTGYICDCFRLNYILREQYSTNWKIQIPDMPVSIGASYMCVLHTLLQIHLQVQIFICWKNNNSCTGIINKWMIKWMILHENFLILTDIHNYKQFVTSTYMNTSSNKPYKQENKLQFNTIFPQSPSASHYHTHWIQKYLLL